MSMGLDISIDGLTFEGFEQGFAMRAGSALEAALLEGAVVLSGSREIGALSLERLDFSTPEALGRSLARAILQEVSA